MPDLGRFIKLGNGKRSWVCANCEDKPEFSRGKKQGRETKGEKRARNVLLGSGHHFTQEYKLQSFYFDFAIHRLRMLVEIDSQSYHRYPRQRARDKVKNDVAEVEKWFLVRILNTSDIEGILAKAICDRENELGIA